MEIFEAFTAYLQIYSGLVALIGTDGVYPDEIPQDRKTAAIVYKSTGGEVGYDLQGKNGLNQPTFQFSCYGKTNKEAYAVYKQLAEAFNVAPMSMNGLEIQFIKQLMEPIKVYEPATKMHSWDVDFQFYF